MGVISTNSWINSLDEHWWWLEDTIASNDFRPSNTTYSVTPAVLRQMKEIVQFRINADQFLDGTFLNYTISGVQVEDIDRDTLTGGFTIDSNGHALLDIVILADNKTEGNETLVLSVENSFGQIEIIDTSRSATQELTQNSTGIVPEIIISGSVENKKFLIENSAEANILDSLGLKLNVVMPEGFQIVQMVFENDNDRYIFFRPKYRFS